MKKIFALLALAFLSSCFETDDISKTWDLGKPDPALVGTWNLTTTEPNPILTGQWHVEQAGNDEKIYKDDPAKFSLARSFIAGPYAFLMVREGTKKHGYICRYLVADHVVRQYELRDDMVIKWALATDPKRKNIIVDGDGSPGTKIAYRFKMLNAGAIAALAAIPNTDAYWKETAEYKKVQ